MDNIINLISTVGFPIVCCIFMWKSYTTTLKELTKVIDRLDTKLDSVLQKLDLILRGGDIDDDG